MKLSGFGFLVVAFVGLGTALPAIAGDPEAIQTGDLTREQRNLAYCAVVLSDKRFGGLRPGEGDMAAAQVLRGRLAKQLEMPDAGLDVVIIPSTMVTVAVETEARGKPRFSATACAGYAHFIRTTPLP